MNPLKAELRKLTAAEIGKSMYDSAESAKETQTRQKGAKEALEAASKAISENLGQIRQAWKDKGVIEGFDPDEVGVLDEELQKKIIQGQIRWVQRAIGSIDAFQISAERIIAAASAKELGFREAERLAKNIFVKEAANIEAFNQGVADGSIQKDEDGDYVIAPGAGEHETHSVVGVHPGLTLKQQRVMEDVEEKKLEGKSFSDPSSEKKSKNGNSKEKPKKKKLSTPAKKRPGTGVKAKR